jgi:hypothetical protein
MEAFHRCYDLVIGYKGNIRVWVRSWWTLARVPTDHFLYIAHSVTGTQNHKLVGVADQGVRWGWVGTWSRNVRLTRWGQSNRREWEWIVIDRVCIKDALGNGAHSVRIYRIKRCVCGVVANESEASAQGFPEGVRHIRALAILLLWQERGLWWQVPPSRSACWSYCPGHLRMCCCWLQAPNGILAGCNLGRLLFVMFLGALHCNGTSIAAVCVVVCWLISSGTV